MATDSAMEVLVEELIDLHSSSLSFRELFKSQQTTALLVTACQSFVNTVASSSETRKRTIRILEKLTHLVLMLALDTHVDAALKQEVNYLSIPWSNDPDTHTNSRSYLPLFGRLRSRLDLQNLTIRLILR